MPKGDKYSRLTEYLNRQTLNEITLTFEQLEKVMNVTIPKSIFKYKTFGSNFNHSFSYGWSLADYNAKADFNSNCVTFTKNGL